MGVRDVVATLASLPALLKLKREMVPRDLADKDCFARFVEKNAATYGDAVAVVTESDRVSWEELNVRANRYAHALKEQGVARGDTVSVMMENRIEFLVVVTAISKLGAVAGLINTNLAGRPLRHCITVTESKKCLFGAEVGTAIGGIVDELELKKAEDFLFVPDDADDACPDWAFDFARSTSNQPESNLPETQDVTLGETAFYIFTSGTTGLPKAAVLSNRRYLMSAGLAGIAGLRLTPSDRIYLCLPLYHGTGLMIGVGSSLGTGASMFLRRKFSASAFLREIREHECTSLVYIGELCRYLMNTEERPDDARTPLVKMMGNGLRPDVWMGFKERFGVDRITEFYGSSEGNVAFANLMNKDCTIGMTSMRVALVKYDVDNDEIIRDASGRCIEVPQGEPGLLLGHISPEAVFEGYTDVEATSKKIITNVIADDDRWFNSGDLIREIDVGFTLGYAHYQFVDRVGDTFRWKSENVSTNEVGEILNGFPSIELANVYGVEIPGADGRAGMAAIRLTEGQSTLDLDAFSQYVRSELAAYARPVFLRIQSEIDVTGTFKMVKGDLKREGYDRSVVNDPLFVQLPGNDHYEPLTDDVWEGIKGSSVGF